MKCTRCGRREATTEVVKSIDNHIQKMYLCDECASDVRSEMGFDHIPKFKSFMSGGPMSILSNISSLFNASQPHVTVCPECRTTSEEFLNTGYVGCPRCYEVFEPLIAQTVKRIQQSDRHVGKTPYGRVSAAKNTAQLKEELKAAMASNDYEKIISIGNMLNNLDRRDGEE